jgi:Flp pilus assembly secretin CpaC
MRRLFLALTAAFCLSAVSAGAASPAATPSAVAVASGQAVTLSLSGSVREIVLGDPLVADVSVINERTLVILGKRAGVTTLFAFDAAGRTIADRRVVVSESPDGAITVQRGAAASIYACGESCSRLPSPNANVP